jgi:hypothetical protein
MLFVMRGIGVIVLDLDLAGYAARQGQTITRRRQPGAEIARRIALLRFHNLSE